MIERSPDLTFYGVSLDPLERTKGSNFNKIDTFIVCKKTVVSCLEQIGKVCDPGCLRNRLEWEKKVMKHSD